MKPVPRLSGVLLLGLAACATAAEPVTSMPHRPHHFLTVDVSELEWDAGEEFVSWDATLRYGGDLDKAVLISEGERTAGHTTDSELYLLWQHAWRANWDWQLGLRTDLQPGDPREDWAVAGLSGVAPGFVETELRVAVSEYEQSELTLDVGRELLLTQRLLLEPALELTFRGRDSARDLQQSGLSGLEAGLRLKYELRREIAPYAGVVWERATADTEELLDALGEDTSETLFVAGISFWY